MRAQHIGQHPEATERVTEGTKLAACTKLSAIVSKPCSVAMGNYFLG